MPQCRDSSERLSLTIPAISERRYHFPPFQKEAKLTLSQWGASLDIRNIPALVSRGKWRWGVRTTLRSPLPPSLISLLPPSTQPPPPPPTSAQGDQRVYGDIVLFYIQE